MKFAAFALPALIFASAAGAQVDSTSSSSPNGTSAQTERNAGNGSEDATDPDRRICRRIEVNTGSRVPHRLVCMTQRQWQAQRRQN
jgi:hypothetical protein